MKTYFTVLALLALLAFGAASDVVELTEDNFDEQIAANKLTLVEFFAPWCGHCKALKPEYDEAAKELAGGEHGVLATVDCTVEKALAERYGIRGFPTLKLFRNDGSEPIDFDQARKADAIVKYMKKQGAPAVADLADTDAANAFADGEPVKVLGFFGDDDAAAKDVFTQVAGLLRNDYEFGALPAASASDFGAESTPAVVLVRTFDEPQVQFEGEFTQEEVAKFVKAESFPLVGEIGPENYSRYVARNLNFVWIFIKPDDEAQTAIVSDQITPVAKAHRSDLSFVKLDGERWAEHAKSFGLSGGTPGIVIEDREARKNYIFPEDKDVTQADFEQFVQGYLDGTLTPNLKSEPVPESNDEPVTVLVGKTFEDIVFDESKDVLVEFYAPWCGHCKSLAPKYDELGEMFKDNANVIIAKIDATANDSPVEVQGFPTLKFWAAGDKSGEPLDYNGERSAKAMADFINENGKATAAAADADADADAGSAGHEDL